MRGLIDKIGVTPVRVVQLGLLPLATLYAFLPPALASRIDLPCLWLTLFGVACPGCGLKSAISCLLHGDFARALAINALSPLVLALLAFLFITTIIETLKERVAWPN